MQELSARQVIEMLDLKPHPEGGHYREVFRSTATITASQPERKRDASTAIYFLLSAGEFSALHRVASDEAWHHYGGAPLELTCISPEGELRRLALGSDIASGQRPLAVVPADHWQAARCLSTSAEGFTLVGCTVAPGFDFQDFEMPARLEMLEKFPNHADLIEAFTRA